MNSFRIPACALCLLVLEFLGCGGVNTDSTTPVVVSLINLDASNTRLEVKVTLDGKSAKSVYPLQANEAPFTLVLPKSSLGRLQVTVDAASDAKV